MRIRAQDIIFVIAKVKLSKWLMRIVGDKFTFHFNVGRVANKTKTLSEAVDWIGIAKKRK